MHPRYTTCGRALEATLIFELFSMTRKLEHLTGRVNKLNSQFFHRYVQSYSVFLYRQKAAKFNIFSL